METKIKLTRDGWVKLWYQEEEILPDGEVCGGEYVVSFGKEGFPSHMSEMYQNKKQAMKRYKNQK